jgi:hypothetical protein
MFIDDLDFEELAWNMGEAAGGACVCGISRHRLAAHLLDEFFEEALFRAKQRY